LNTTGWPLPNKKNKISKADISK
jgi:hypothetical protein